MRAAEKPIDAVAAASARAMEALSLLRGKRIFHPFGVGFRARLTPLGTGIGAGALDRETEAVARLSRALGLPEWLPDPCGLAIRVPDAHGPGLHQDLLLVSSSRAVLGRHAVLPSRGFLDRPYSTLLPYELGGRKVFFTAVARGSAAPRTTLAELRRRSSAEIDFDLLVAEARGDWRPVARISLGERLEPERTERLDFDPGNSGGGLRPAGIVNRLRGPSYRGSQAGREAAYRRRGLPH